MGWPIVPEGLTRVLCAAYEKAQQPIIVTENGIADAADTQRSTYIREHVGAAFEAKRLGVDLRGFCYWSLLDNFEWHEGFWPRFGLVEIDYATQQRTLRQSAATLTQMIAKYS